MSEEKWYPEFSKKYVLKDDCLIAIGPEKFITVAEIKRLYAECAELKARLIEAPEQKPDGYLVTWPGYAPHHFRIYGNWDTAVFCEARDLYDIQLDSSDVIAAKLDEKGYRIRPVKLLFLDDPKPQGEE